MLFDTTDALSLILLWIVFSYLTVLLNCDLQRLLTKSPLFLHTMAFVAFFFLITNMDPNNSADIHMVAGKTLFVYVIFVLVTKSKWYFALPVILLLLVDQAIKGRERILANRTDQQQEPEGQTQLSKNVYYSNGLRAAIVVLVLMGTFNYVKIQKAEYKGRFSWFKFFFGLSNKCKARSLL